MIYVVRLCTSSSSVIAQRAFDESAVFLDVAVRVTK